MKSPFVTQESVCAACDTIKAAGGDVTYKAVRDLLGGGSNSTLQPYIDAYNKASRPAPKPVPQPLEERMKMFLGGLWAMACEATQPELDRVRAEAQAKVQSLEDALHSSMAIGAALEADKNGLEGRFQTLAAECIELRVRLRQQEPLAGLATSADSSARLNAR